MKNKKKIHVGMRTQFIFLVMAELIIAMVASWIIVGIFKISIDLPAIVWLIIFSVLIGGALNDVISRIFFAPIMKLGDAMRQVAKGDLNVTLETNSSSNEIREIYSDFNLMTKELRATEILQTDFVSNVSHEFKTPINAIEGYATLLQGGNHLDPQEQKIYVEKILFNTRRLSNLVGNILLLSKIDNQAIQSKQSQFRLDEQIRQSIVILEPEWIKKDIELDVDLEDVEYTGNESLLHHVWDNLIGNAIKFSPYGGTIFMKMRREGNRIVYQIDDCGPGISEEAKRHIFDKFYQSDSSHKEEGNGLGLALVKQILHLCDGEVSVENLSEGGCRFTVMLNNSNAG